MLFRLSIKNRSPEELLALAAERRELAVGKNAVIRAQLLNEAKLLEFHADLRAWTNHSRHSDTQSNPKPPWGDGELPNWLLTPELAPVLTRLRSRLALPISDQQAILTGAVPPRSVDRGQCILEPGEPQRFVYFLCSGAARAYRSLDDGIQQTVALFLPGDVINPDSLVLPVESRHSICMLGPSVVLEIPICYLTSLAGERPGIMRAMYAETALRAAIQKEWIVCLGRFPAEGRLAHLLCEVCYRQSLGAPNKGEALKFAMTQHQLAETVGLSTVHVNRMLQSLRRQKLITLDRSELTIRDWQTLCGVAQFDPAYLEFPGLATRPASGLARG